ncbi:MAG: YwiC-like family protein, partial [Acidimicrobiales bacterium]|nr:YwiC-like family protein [Acidimicrobiales bacterium]
MTVHHADATPDKVAARERSTLRAVAIPTEHGGWSLTLEPVLLGLLVAWSWPGLSLGVAAMLAFLARTPVKLVLVDGWRGRWLTRTTVAAQVAGAELLVLATLVTAAALTADARFWWPLLAAAPLVAIELWFDMRSRSRRLLPELAGNRRHRLGGCCDRARRWHRHGCRTGLVDRGRGTRRSGDPLCTNTGDQDAWPAVPAVAQRPRTSCRRDRGHRRMAGRRRPSGGGRRNRRGCDVQRRSSARGTSTGQDHRLPADVLRR